MLTTRFQHVCVLLFRAYFCYEIAMDNPDSQGMEQLITESVDSVVDSSRIDWLWRWSVEQVPILLFPTIEFRLLITHKITHKSEPCYQRTVAHKLVILLMIFTVRLCEAYAHGIAVEFLSVRLSVRPSVCLSVRLSNACIVTKRKHLAKKSSVMTNRKSPTSFPMCLRWTSYVAHKPPKGASKAQIWPIICNNFVTVRDRM